MVNIIKKINTAHPFLFRNSKDMPNDVIDCLKDIIQNHGGLSKEDSEKYFKEMEMRGRFQCETWS